MSEATPTDSTAMVQAVAPVAQGTTSERSPSLLLPGGEVDAEIMAVLAKTQNKCFAEMGYYPALLQEHRELQQQYTLLRTDNQKLYADNYNLSQFVQAQEQRINALAGPADQGRRAIEEVEGRLHAALNEIRLLRQELSRFIPSAMIVPAQERMMVGHPSQVPHSRVVSMPVAQQRAVEPVSHMIPYQRPPHSQQQHRPIQPLPAPRQSLPNLSPIDTSAPPTIAYHRRTSAPVAGLAHQNGAGPGSASASPIGNFNGLRLASPATNTPVSSRPSTSGAPTTSTNHTPAEMVQRPSSGPASALYRVPAQAQRSTPSSLAGAIIDLTADESREQDGSRKRRKTDHGPEMEGPPPQPYLTQTATPVTPSSWSPPDGYIPRTHLNGTQAHPPQDNTSPSTSSAQHQPAQPSQPIKTSSPEPLEDDVDMDQETTLDEDCLPANFITDDEDENKQWCMMCRSRYQSGHVTEAPPPFIGASQEELIAHCESVHPRGWETLKQTVSARRGPQPAADPEPV